MAKIRVGVFMGGMSAEKEVSFNSGRTICDHIDVNNYDIIPLFQHHDGILYILPWHFLHRGKIDDFAHRLKAEAQTVLWDDLKTIVDFIYIAAHGRFSEDGSLQGFLQILGIPYLGSGVFSSALCMDKIMQKMLLKAEGITVPRDIIINKKDAIHMSIKLQKIVDSLVEKKINFPLVIKPHHEGSSLGVSVIHTPDDLDPAIQKACFVNPDQPQAVLIEEKITGMEFSCIVLTDYKTGNRIPLQPTEIVHERGTDFFDYTQKYMPGRATKFTPARTTPAIITAIQETSVAVAQILGIETIARIDGIVRDDGAIVIFDPNSLAGMGPSSFVFNQAATYGLSHTQLINHLIETELYGYGMLAPAIQKTHDIDHMSNKIRVAVLLGGRSNEKETSLDSGRNVIYKLSPQRYD